MSVATSIKRGWESLVRFKRFNLVFLCFFILTKIIICKNKNYSPLLLEGSFLSSWTLSLMSLFFHITLKYHNKCIRPPNYKNKLNFEWNYQFGVVWTWAGQKLLDLFSLFAYKWYFRQQFFGAQIKIPPKIWFLIFFKSSSNDFGSDLFVTVDLIGS